MGYSAVIKDTYFMQNRLKFSCFPTNLVENKICFVCVKKKKKIILKK